MTAVSSLAAGAAPVKDGSTHLPLWLVLFLASGMAKPAIGATEAATPAGPAETSASSPAPAPEPRTARRRFEGAIGLVSRVGQAYAGSSDSNFENRLGGYVRWGRLTISGRGGFVDRRADETTAGASYDLHRGADWRISLTARSTSGRRESSSDQLRGMGDLPSSFRLRLSANRSLNPVWKLRLSANTDVGGKQLGTLYEASVGRQWTLSPTSRVIAGLTLSLGDQRYMQAWHGVTPAQSNNSGYAVYSPGVGLREASATLIYRKELGTEDGGLIGGRWAFFSGATLGRLLGPAERSPLTFNANSWQLNAGLAKRF